jgi:flagellar biosynthesis component FlhA
LPSTAAAMLVGLLAYGVSLALFVASLRHVGTARTGAYFSIAPFFGAVLAVLMGEPMTIQLVVAGVLMAIGTWAHLTEHHEHTHTHEWMTHDHEHVHDEHHSHDHDHQIEPGTRHRHLHTHSPLTHSHRHFPEAHHRHCH